MDRATYDKLPVGSVLTNPAWQCPYCQATGETDVVIVLAAKPVGSFSLAGTQMKFSAVRSAEGHCNACGRSFPAEPEE